MKREQVLLLLALFAMEPSYAERRPSVRIVRTPSSVSMSQRDFKVGASLGFDGLWGKTSTSEVLAKGLGYSIGLSAQMRVAEIFRFLFSPSYQYLRLGRPFDGSGQLQEPSPASLDQSVKAIGFSLLGSYEIERGGESSAPVWWFDVGGQLLFPLSASQTVSGSTVSFTAEKGFLLLLGTTAEFNFSPGLDLTASLHGFYNLAGSSESRYFGVRLLAGVLLHI